MGVEEMIRTRTMQAVCLLVLACGHGEGAHDILSAVTTHYHGTENSSIDNVLFASLCVYECFNKYT